MESRTLVTAPSMCLAHNLFTPVSRQQRLQSCVKPVQILLIDSFAAASRWPSINLVNILGYQGIERNKTSHRTATSALRHAQTVPDNKDVSLYVTLGRIIMSRPYPYFLRPRVPRALPRQTDTSITTCSGT